ncbi:sulfite exporter TauE/SafE family protein [Stutzerimonas tarimensis]|uniref:Probable membrane transporter protein n=1 Tax=Stutzerimonas tarimensis TaxID=1507735 RepID=A0ABV7TA16_9GAMM
MTTLLHSTTTRLPLAAATGLAIGALGGLIGLGGAEFRLPLLIGLFGFSALAAVILNKAMSLVVVSAALLFRAQAIPFPELLAHWPIVLNLLAGSLLGAWFGAGWATRMKSQTLYHVLAALLLLIAVALLFGHGLEHTDPLLDGAGQVAAGIVAGFAIGIIASLMGVAGGEFLIPTLILLFGTDVKLAGSLSLAVSLPTMLIGFARYSRDRSFSVIQQNLGLVLAMAAGSVIGAWFGGILLTQVSAAYLLPLLSVILAISAVKLWRHR